jgi:hypothetical protein
MKTTKLILLSVLMAIAFLGFSVAQTTSDNTQLTKEHPVVKIHIKEVVSNPGLLNAVIHQVSPTFLELYHPGYYVFHVKFHSTEYMVFGEYKSWRDFFGSENVIGGH